jgi:hypothetical protein
VVVDQKRGKKKKKKKKIIPGSNSFLTAVQVPVCLQVPQKLSQSQALNKYFVY